MAVPTTSESIRSAIEHQSFNRWWIIPASLGINLDIGQVSAFSVFNLPLTRVMRH
jgi:hypothetical protein